MKLIPDSTVTLGRTERGTFVYGITSPCHEWLLDNLHAVIDAGPDIKGTADIDFMANRGAEVQVDIEGRFNAKQLRKLADVLESMNTAN